MTLLRRVTPQTRRHQRYALDGEVEVRAGEHANRLTVQARDLSESGFSFISEIPLLEGEHVWICPRYARGTRLLATVRHVECRAGLWVMGVEFATLLTPGQYDLLRNS
jgi:hypothetical protein